MLSNQEEAEKMAKQGRIHIEKHFTVERMVDETVSVYKKLLK